MKRKNIKGIFSKPMDSNADPIIENRNLPAMPEVKQDLPGRRKNPPKGKGLMSQATPAAKITKSAVAKGLQMAPFNQRENSKVKTQVPPQGYQDQVPTGSRKKIGTGYVVLRMTVRNGEMIVEGSQKVDGPLLVHDELIQSGLTYEASLKNNRISIGSIPDFAEQRSFPRPGSDPSHAGHHITLLPSFNFNLKVPADSLALKDLKSLNVRLYRFKEHVPNLVMSKAPLHVEHEKEVRIVAELNGIQVEKLPKDVKESIKKSFKK